MTTKDPVVLTYTCEVSVGSPSDVILAQNTFNKAWGFSDGHCNEVDADGKFVSKPGADDPEFLEAHHRLVRSSRLSVEVSVHKSGRKTFWLNGE